MQDQKLPRRWLTPTTDPTPTQTSKKLLLIIFFASNSAADLDASYRESSSSSRFRKKTCRSWPVFISFVKVVLFWKMFIGYFLIILLENCYRKKFIQNGWILRNKINVLLIFLSLHRIYRAINNNKVELQLTSVSETKKIRKKLCHLTDHCIGLKKTPKLL